MSYDIRLVKLTSGEMVLGEYDKTADAIKNPAALQTVPTQQGVQMMIMPYGYPFEQDFSGYISFQHVLYQYKSCPKDIETRYMEATSSLTIASGGLGGLDLKGGEGGIGNIADLLKR